MGTDINPEAIKIAQKTINRYGMTEHINLICTNLIEQIEEKIDVLIFNPVLNKLM